MESKYGIWNKAYMRDIKTNISVKILYLFPQIMAYTTFERTVKRRILTEIFHFWSTLKRSRRMFWSFSAIWICIKNQNLGKWESEDDLDLFLNGPNFMGNGILIRNGPTFMGNGIIILWEMVYLFLCCSYELF